ncbi:hypothetical protein NMY22_g17366 [Coprinellus aureogranulatus]|nr:hypothetical protein NMY22_g17366 [Coprinellus aureogranulatus]
MPPAMPPAIEEEIPSFEDVATAVAVYKVAKYFAELAEEDPNSTPEEKQRRSREFNNAQSMITELTETMDVLSAGARQQLLILYNEMHNERRSKPYSGTCFRFMLITVPTSLDIDDHLKAKLSSGPRTWEDTGVEDNTEEETPWDWKDEPSSSGVAKLHPGNAGKAGDQDQASLSKERHGSPPPVPVEHDAPSTPTGKEAKDEDRPSQGSLKISTFQRSPFPSP